MSSPRLRRKVRSSGLLEHLTPPDTMQLQHALGQVLDPTGTLLRDAIRPYLPPAHYRFHVPGVLVVGPAGGKDQIIRGGFLTRVTAFVETSPSGGPCVLELRDGAGAVLATVTIPAGASEGDSPGLSEELLTNQWIGVHVVQANGAADVSVVATEVMR